MTPDGYVLADSGTYHYASCSYLHYTRVLAVSASEIVEASYARSVKACGHCRPLVEGVGPTAKERQRQEWADSPQGRFRETFGRDLTRRELQIALLRIEARWPGVALLAVEETDSPWTP